MSGYATIRRSLLGHTAFRNDAEAMAFAWLIVKAAWRPSKVRYKDRLITLERGQLAISVRDFANAMDRDKAWIERLLRRLKSETMVETHCETGVNIVTVCNYEKYQSVPEGRETPVETVGETPRETVVRQSRDTEQEEKESFPNGKGQPPDQVKILYDYGVQVFVSAGRSGREARSMVSKWRKRWTTQELMHHLVTASSKADPLEYIQGIGGNEQASTNEHWAEVERKYANA